MARGRPPKGPGLVDSLEGPDETKERLRVILETIAGVCSVSEACRTLDLGKTAFSELRTRALEAALRSIEPRPAGRPAKVTSPEQSRVEGIVAENQTLRRDLAAAQLREEIALTMPHLRQSTKEASKKKRTPGSRRSRQNRRPRRSEVKPSNGGRSGT